MDFSNAFKNEGKTKKKKTAGCIVGENYDSDGNLIAEVCEDPLDEFN